MKEKNIFYGIIFYYIIDTIAIVGSKLNESIINLLRINPILIPLINLIIYVLIVLCFIIYVRKPILKVFKLWFVILLVIIRLVFSYLGNISYVQNDLLTANKLSLLLSIDKALFLLFNISIILLAYIYYKRLSNIKDQ
jgi:hypothetical protein